MSRRILAVLISVVLALVGTTVVLLYVRSADARAMAGKKGRTVILVEKRIPAGTSGRALRSNGFLRTATMPAETVPGDALGRYASNLDALVVTSEVQRGQLLLRTMFGTPSATYGVPVPDGMVAAATRVRASAFGPGTVATGAKVAIFYTYTPVDDAHRDAASGAGLEKQHATNSVTRLLLNNIEILAVGQQTPGTAGGGGSGNGTGSAKTATDSTAGGGTDFLVVTFALAQADAERLAHAVALGGELNIAMLGESSGVKPDSGIDNRTLFS